MEIRRIESAERLSDAFAVRRAVFVEEQGVPEAREMDGNDSDAIHFVVYDDEEPIGAARLRQYDGAERTAKVERVAVVPARRSSGVGRELMAVVETAAREADYEKLILHAQQQVVDFYERLGYEATGDPFEEAGIPHRKMTKSLGTDH